MKYQIVEHKYPNGEHFFRVQQRRRSPEFFWLTSRWFDHFCRNKFDTAEDAEVAINGEKAGELVFGERVVKEL